MDRMFLSAQVFDQSLGSWDLSAMAVMDRMLEGSGLSRASYDATLIGWQGQASTPMGMVLGATGLMYCAGDAARAALIANLGWTITGDTLDCTP